MFKDDLSFVKKFDYSVVLEEFIKQTDYIDKFLNLEDQDQVKGFNQRPNSIQKKKRIQEYIQSLVELYED